jgi:tRNA(Arg) A34 adenosine deaminase TadA
MCLGAIYWARPARFYFACTKEDAADAGFDDQFIYEEIARTHKDRKLPVLQMGRDIALEAFEEWKNKNDKIEY